MLFGMSDFSFNEHIQENSGFYGAMGGVAHLRNQSANKFELQKQTRALEKQVEQQKKSAQEQSKLAKAMKQSAGERAESEKARLELEKKRFELEEKERAYERDKKVQVKELRKFLLQLSDEVDELMLKYS